MELAAWSPADVEPARCCLCGTSGVPVHRLHPFTLVRCPACTLHFVSPRLRPAALQGLYEDVRYFEGGVYGRPGVRWSATMTLQRAWAAGRLRLIEQTHRRGPAGLRLLEVGCGYGHFLSAARTRGYEVVGVDRSATAVAHASSVLGLHAHAAELDAAPLVAPFDVICAWDTVEHVPDPVAMLRSARALVAEDGLLAFSLPDVSSWPARLLGRRWRALKPSEHLWHFSPRTLGLAAQHAGLEVTRIMRSPLRLSNLTRLDSLVVLARPSTGRDPAAFA